MNQQIISPENGIELPLLARMGLGEKTEAPDQQGKAPLLDPRKSPEPENPVANPSPPPPGTVDKSGPSPKEVQRTDGGNFLFQEENFAAPKMMNSEAPGKAPAARESTPAAGLGGREAQPNLNSIFPEANLPENSGKPSFIFSRGAEPGSADAGWKGQEKNFSTGDGDNHFTEKEPPSPQGIYGISLEGKEAAGRISEKPVLSGPPSPGGKAENLPVSQQVSHTLLWSLRNNEEKVRITLDPPELGHISLEIHRSSESIKTTLWTDNPVTKVTLETAHPEIQKIIENEGFRLEKFDVFVQQQMGGHQEGKGEAMSHNSRTLDHPSETRAPFAEAPDPLPGLVRGAHPASRYLDLFV